MGWDLIMLYVCCIMGVVTLWVLLSFKGVLLMGWNPDINWGPEPDTN